MTWYCRRSRKNCRLYSAQKKSLAVRRPHCLAIFLDLHHHASRD